MTDAQTEEHEQTTWHDVGAAADFAPERGRCVTVEDRELAVFRTESGWHAIDNSCPHAGAPLSDGDLDDEGHVWCVWHGWAFDLRTGACEVAPETPVGVHHVRVADGRVLVALAHRGRG